MIEAIKLLASSVGVHALDHVDHALAEHTPRILHTAHTKNVLSGSNLELSKGMIFLSAASLVVEGIDTVVNHKKSELLADNPEKQKLREQSTMTDAERKATAEKRRQTTKHRLLRRR